MLTNMIVCSHMWSSAQNWRQWYKRWKTCSWKWWNYTVIRNLYGWDFKRVNSWHLPFQSTLSIETSLSIGRALLQNYTYLLGFETMNKCMLKEIDKVNKMCDDLIKLVRAGRFWPVSSGSGDESTCTFLASTATPLSSMETMTKPKGFSTSS